MIEDDEAKWEHDWRDRLQRARFLPGMFIGDQQTGHRIAVKWALSLIWDAKVFSDPEFVSLSLSPHQYVVRCVSGPLLLPIQKMTTWAGKRILTEGWNEAIRAKIEQDGRVGRRRGWRYAFTGPTGPRLDSPTYPSVFARRFVFGIRTDAGLWCQTFAEGWPQSRPFLMEKPSRIGLVIAADLDSEWFTGLPFTQEDSERLLTLRKDHSYMRRVRRHATGDDDLVFQKREQIFPFPNTQINWHDENDLVNDISLSASGIQEWL